MKKSLAKRDLIILCGGKGTRLRSVVPDVPKPMAPIDGKPFLRWLLDWWAQWECIDLIILCVNYKYKVIERHFGNEYKGMEIFYKKDELKTSEYDILRAAERYCEMPYFVCNGDTLIDIDPRELLYAADMFRLSTRLMVPSKSGEYISSGLGCHWAWDYGIKPIQKDTQWIDIGTPEEYRRAQDGFISRQFFKGS